MKKNLNFFQQCLNLFRFSFKQILHVSLFDSNQMNEVSRLCDVLADLWFTAPSHPKKSHYKFLYLIRSVFDQVRQKVKTVKAIFLYNFKQIYNYKLLKFAPQAK